MERQDYNLGRILKYENVAWFDEEDGAVKILDRRIYPVEEKFVICKTYQETAKAITDMVTQSGGPFSAAAMGMALAAYQLKNLDSKNYLLGMENAAFVLSHARPTTSGEMKKHTSESLSIFKQMLEKNYTANEIIIALKQNAIHQNNLRYKKNTEAGGKFADIVPDGSTILTQCFGETTVGGFLRRFKETKKNIKIICCETRPFFQGARLTASLADDMGFDTTIITDNTAAFLMSQQKIHFFVSAADLITENGFIINKIGTLQLSICANYFKIPYYVIGFPDVTYKTIKDVKIEYRNSEEIFYAMNSRITSKGNNIQAVYPAFDITPPNLCSGIVTDKGIVKYS